MRRYSTDAEPFSLGACGMGARDGMGWYTMIHTNSNPNDTHYPYQPDYFPSNVFVTAHRCGVGDTTPIGEMPDCAREAFYDWACNLIVWMV